MACHTFWNGLHCACGKAQTKAGHCADGQTSDTHKAPNSGIEAILRRCENRGEEETLAKRTLYGTFFLGRRHDTRTCRPARQPHFHIFFPRIGRLRAGCDRGAATDVGRLEDHRLDSLEAVDLHYRRHFGEGVEYRSFDPPQPGLAGVPERPVEASNVGIHFYATRRLCMHQAIDMLPREEESRLNTDLPTRGGAVVQRAENRS